MITHRLPNVNHTQRTPLKCMILNFYFDKIKFSIRNLKDIIIVLKRIFFVFILTNGFKSINFMGLNYGVKLWEKIYIMRIFLEIEMHMGMDLNLRVLTCGRI